jgi:Zn-dependent M16 (insulinase) family peptidase
MFDQPAGEGGTVADPLGLKGYVTVRGKATAEKAADLFDLAHTLLADANLEGGQQKVIEILRETQSRLETAFISSGNAFAGSRLGARNTLYGYVGEITQGVSFYDEVKRMLAQSKDDWPTLLSRLQRVRDTLLAQNKLIINLTADPDMLEKVRPTVETFVAKLPATAKCDAQVPAWRDAAALLPAVDEAYAITTQVNYVAMGARLFEPGSKPSGAYYVVARFLSRGYLWDNVRVVGGAYGGGCSFNPRTGGFNFSSYRDPNVQGTLDIYAKSADALEELVLTDDALEQAIVGAVGDLDNPMNSQQKGFFALTLHLTGVTTEARQRYRDEVLGTSRESYAEFAKALRAGQFKTAIFGSKEALEQANSTRSDDEKITIKQLS